MPGLDAKMSHLAEQVLNRALTKEESHQIYKIADAMGMKDVQSFLHQLLVFKMHEDTLKKQFDSLGSLEERLNERFNEMASLEAGITDTLESVVTRILSEGAEKIGSNMGNEIAAQTKGIFSAVGSYHMLKGRILAACGIYVAGALGYFLGAEGILHLAPNVGALKKLLFLPAGWCLILCGAAYTFLWIGDNWYQIKTKKWYKAFLAAQIIALLLFSGMLI